MQHLWRGEKHVDKLWIEESGDETEGYAYISAEMLLQLAPLTDLLQKDHALCGARVLQVMTSSYSQSRHFSL